ncbi:MAG: GatB/YqeY domain-containing protein, partial [Flavobacteriales bacterium]
KQRKDAAAIYIEQGRADLADDEMAQTKILDQFLPQQMSAEELENAVANIIVKVGAKGPADMGKVMGVTSKELAGKAEGRAIADTVKALLNK